MSQTADRDRGRDQFGRGELALCFSQSWYGTWVSSIRVSASIEAIAAPPPRGRSPGPFRCPACAASRLPPQPGLPEDFLLAKLSRIGRQTRETHMQARPTRKVSLSLAAGAALLGVGIQSAHADGSLQIGTGGVTGVYYPAGGAICRLVNKERKEHGIRCSVEATGGSVDNIKMLRQGEVGMGIVQSDVQYQALKGEGEEFQSQGPFAELRSVFSIHPEPFTVVARDDSGIRTFDELKGKRVNIGNPGSGQRSTMEVIMQRLGWTIADFKLASELKSAEQADALANDQIDAIVFTVGHPSGAIQEATTTADAHLVPVAGPGIEALIKELPYYTKTVIPGGIYRGTPHDVETFGVRATLVTSAKAPADIVYQVVKAVFENFDEFKKLHPAFEHLKKEEMVTQALSAPLHPGAEKYYKEAGLL
jgi:TRAP transporter TAXI family solute receptor